MLWIMYRRSDHFFLLALIGKFSNVTQEACLPFPRLLPPSMRGRDSNELPPAGHRTTTRPPQLHSCWNIRASAPPPACLSNSIRPSSPSSFQRRSGARGIHDHSSRAHLLPGRRAPPDEPLTQPPHHVLLIIKSHFHSPSFCSLS